MIIRNNFDEKRDLPSNNDYEKIGKGSDNMDKKIEKNKIVNPWREIEERDDRENDEEEKRDNWEFFK